MFDRLQRKWKVSGIQLFLILCTFAIGGSLTGFVGKRIMNLLPLEKGVFWVIVYIILVTLIWPLMVLLVSVFFGQFTFFTKYLRKMGARMGISKNPASSQQKVAIFASGAGSNAQKIIDHFRGSATVRISLIACNKPGAGVLQIAEKEGIPVLLIEKERFFRADAYTSELTAAGIDFVVLAGFLWKIPTALINAYRGRIINIHPALLPNYGGKGMYGQFVHAAVIAAGDKESGITIHYVDEQYDHGATIFQARCPVLPSDTPETLAARIHALEHEYFPKTIESLLENEKVKSKK